MAYTPAPQPWATTADAHLLWPESATIDPGTLLDLLTSAGMTCTDNARPDVASLPEFERSRAQATVLQARQTWTAYRRDGDVIGFDQYAVRVRPLTSDVLALLGRARVGPRVG